MSHVRWLLLCVASLGGAGPSQAHARRPQRRPDPPNGVRSIPPTRSMSSSSTGHSGRRAHAGFGAKNHCQYRDAGAREILRRPHLQNAGHHVVQWVKERPSVARRTKLPAEDWAAARAWPSDPLQTLNAYAPETGYVRRFPVAARIPNRTAPGSRTAMAWWVWGATTRRTVATAPSFTSSSVTRRVTVDQATCARWWGACVRGHGSCFWVMPRAKGSMGFLRKAGRTPADPLGSGGRRMCRKKSRSRLEVLRSDTQSFADLVRVAPQPRRGMVQGAGEPQKYLQRAAAACGGELSRGQNPARVSSLWRP